MQLIRHRIGLQSEQARSVLRAIAREAAQCAGYLSFSLSDLVGQSRGVAPQLRRALPDSLGVAG